MSKKLILSGALLALTAGMGQAGDTVTINLPGGATQTVSATATAGSIVSSSGQLGGLIGGSGGTDSIISSVVQNPTTGALTFVSVGGRSFTVTSSFIGTVLNYYGD